MIINIDSDVLETTPLFVVQYRGLNSPAWVLCMVIDDQVAIQIAIEKLRAEPHYRKCSLRLIQIDAKILETYLPNEPIPTTQTNVSGNDNRI